MTVEYSALASAIEITTANRVIRFQESGQAEVSATLTTGTYYVWDRTQSDSLLNAIETALEAASPGVRAYTVSVQSVDATANPSVVVRIAVGSGTVILTWGSASTTFDSTTIGHTQATTASLATHDGTRQPSTVWVADEPLARSEPPRSRAVRAVHQGPQGHRSVFSLGDVLRPRVLAWEWVSGRRALEEHATDDEDFQSWWETASDGRRVRAFSDGPASTALTLVSAELLGGATVWTLGEVEQLPVPEPRPDIALERYHIGPLVLHPYQT